MNRREGGCVSNPAISLKSCKVRRLANALGSTDWRPEFLILTPWKYINESQEWNIQVPSSNCRCLCAVQIWRDVILLEADWVRYCRKLVKLSRANSVLGIHVGPYRFTEWCVAVMEDGALLPILTSLELINFTSNIAVTSHMSVFDICNYLTTFGDLNYGTFCEIKKMEWYTMTGDGYVLAKCLLCTVSLHDTRPTRVKSSRGHSEGTQ